MQLENTYGLLWLLLLLPAAALLYLTIRWKKKLQEKIGDSRLVANLFTDNAPKRFLTKGILSLLVLAFLTIAFVNPRRPDSTEKVKLTGTDLMIALDVSNSMLANDIQPTRLDKAKLLIGKLIDKLQGNRIGMVVFAGNAYLQMPLTTDASAARLFLSTISPGLVPYQGTNISEALQVCNRSFNTAEKKYKSILLISDGEDHDNTTLETAEKLKGQGVVINTIGVGSPQGSTLPDPATAQPRKDDQGNVVISKLNEADLQKIASATNGAYVLLNNAEATADDVAKDLSAMDQKPITDSTLTNFTSYYWWFVLMAAVLLITEIVLSEKKRKMKGLKPAATALLLFFFVQGFAQKQEIQQVRKGNEAYRKQDFENAAKDYEAVLKTNTSNNAAAFNLGNTRFRSGKYEEAAKQYDALNSSGDKKLQARGLYNKALANIRQQKLPEAINDLKQSLRLNPNDEETRENLQKALNQKKQQDQQQQQKNKDDKDKDKKKKDQQNKQDKQDQQKNNKDPQQDKQQQQPPPKIDKQDAEQKLQALRQEEKKLQQKLNDRQPANVRQPAKDW